MAKTPLYQEHIKLNAKIVDFHGWDLPIHYGSQIDEHHAVRKDCGMFDVSHMTAVDMGGPEAQAFLRYLFANDVAKLNDGKALYTAMLNDQGGILDDLIVYQINSCHYRIVFNAATCDKDLAWVDQHIKDFDAELLRRNDLCIIAIQGPYAREKTLPLLPEALQTAAELKPFHFMTHGDWLVARTGYTGEDGFEVMLPHEAAVTLWQQLALSGIQACGLGARDTLRLESGLNLYGQDMDETVTPLESNIAWTVAFEPLDRDFIGRSVLEKQAQCEHNHLVGIRLNDRGVLRAEQNVLLNGKVIGITTSGTFSPTMNKGIAFARVDEIADQCDVEVRNKVLSARMIELPFVRRGKIVCEQKKEVD